MSRDELEVVIEKATKMAAERLFSETEESFYYFALITSGEAHAPYVSAWSQEQLTNISEEMRDLVKWSYADSPYCEFGSEYFGEVEELFGRRPNILEMEESGRSKEYELRLSAMESAICRLNDDGVFGSGEERDRIVVNVEVMPPDRTNTERAIRLNPRKALGDWLREAAE